MWGWIQNQAIMKESYAPLTEKTHFSQIQILNWFSQIDLGLCNTTADLNHTELPFLFF